jgi:hypothetical protein
MDNVLDILGNTQAFVNYVEGEISFDILDDNDLKDIATSSRQSFDINDKRIDKLKSILKPIVSELINKRQQLAKQISNSEEEYKFQIDTKSKLNYSLIINEEFVTIKEKIKILYGKIKQNTLVEKYENEFSEIKNELASTQISMMNGIKGDTIKDGAEAKTEYRLFFSHKSGVDSLFAKFVFDLLTDVKKINKSEIFFTEDYSDQNRYNNLEQKIRDCIKSENTQIVYFATDSFKDSSFCMFEGGAG